MSIMAKIHRWSRSQERPDRIRVTLHLNDRNALKLCEELGQLSWYTDERYDYALAVARKDPWKMLKHATIFGHPILRLNPPKG